MAARRRGGLRALRHRRVSTWWEDAKLGIFVHWTPASVPAFAPVDVDIGELLRSGRPNPLAWSPYTEWYENSLRFPESPVARHHREVWRGCPYAAFAADWEAGLETWDPDGWAARFAATGARYVVLVAKHHDGYCLWPTSVPNPRRPGWHCRRDVVGELAEAVRGAGLRFGVYYSGGLDWTFDDRPMGTFAQVLAAIPRGPYPAYAEAHVRELVDRYRPSVLWNDIAWPAEGRRLWALFADYYHAVPDGVVNDRWMPWGPLLAAARLAGVGRVIDAGARRAARRDAGIVPPRPPHYDVRTPEYTVFDRIQDRPWECVRGMDHSFGYNARSRPEHFVSRQDLLWSLADIAAKGGNLLLNVGPRGVDAGIPDEQAARLDWLGAWAPWNRDAIVATRPWARPGEETAEGGRVRYTARDDSVHAIVEPAGGRQHVTLPDVGSTPTTAVTDLDGRPLPWRATPVGVEVAIDAGPGDEPVAIRLRDVEARAHG
jgi:alpha-L-fucosidase